MSLSNKAVGVAFPGKSKGVPARIQSDQFEFAATVRDRGLDGFFGVVCCTLKYGHSHSRSRYFCVSAKNDTLNGAFLILKSAHYWGGKQIEDEACDKNRSDRTRIPRISPLHGGDIVSLYLRQRESATLPHFKSC